MCNQTLVLHKIYPLQQTPKIDQVLALCILMLDVRNSGRDNPWFMGELSNLIRDRNAKARSTNPLLTVQPLEL